MPYDLLHVLNSSRISQCNVFKVRIAAEILPSLQQWPWWQMFSSHSLPAHPSPLSLDPGTRGMDRPQDDRSLGLKIHAVSILSHWPSEHFMSSHQRLLFLNTDVKSEDQSVQEPDAWYFSSACFVKCKVRPSLCVRFNHPALAAFLQGALLTVNYMSESLFKLAAWGVWPYKYLCKSASRFFDFPYRMLSSV